MKDEEYLIEVLKQDNTSYTMLRDSFEVADKLAMNMLTLLDTKKVTVSKLQKLELKNYYV